MNMTQKHNEGLIIQIIDFSVGLSYNPTNRNKHMPT